MNPLLRQSVETWGQRCKSHNASSGAIDLSLVSLESCSPNEWSALYTQDADAPHLSLPVDVRRVEIENTLAGVARRDQPRRRWLERKGRDRREWEGEGTIVTGIDARRDLLAWAVWPDNVQSNRRFETDVDDPVDHSSSSIIRPDRV